MKSGNISYGYYEATKEDIEYIEKHKLSFQASDVLSHTEAGKLLEIHSIIINKDNRDQGFGSEMLASLCQGKDDVVIIAGAGAITKEFEEEPTTEQYNELFAKLDKFYTKNNFQDVTQLFGTYDGTTKRTFLYLNDAGNKAIKDRETFIKNHKLGGKRNE